MSIVERVECMFASTFDGENLWRVPKKPSFNAKSYPARVRYAAWAICAGDDSRNHDTCFEMYDGEAVVVALMRAAMGGKADYLKHCLQNHSLTEAGWKSWQRKMEKNAFWEDELLPELAKCLREEGRAVARHFHTELTNAGEQAVIPGCEKNADPKATQLNLFG